jgi:hypothetical protein
MSGAGTPPSTRAEKSLALSFPIAAASARAAATFFCPA